MAAGEIQHIGWAYERPDGKSRGFGTTGGHYHETWGSHDWRTLILNAIAWTSGVEIPKMGFHPKRLRSSKIAFASTNHVYED